jgi:glycosyltransferase involved in cell wall biosynthesis
MMQNIQPIFSIIIPTFNRAGQLRRALESIERQTSRDFEVIVCDDGSTDDTESVVGEFAKRMPIEYIRENNWGGPARPRNNGIRAARAEWLCFLDADDWWYPDKLETAAKFLTASDLIHHDLDLFPTRVIRLVKRFKGRQLKVPVLADLMVNGNVVFTSSVCVRRQLVIDAGCFSEDKALISVEDFDLWLKIAQRTEHFLHIPRTLGVYWMGNDGISRASECRIERLRRIFERHAPYLASADRVQAELLLFFLTGKVRQQMGQYEEALDLFRRTKTIKNSKFRLLSYAMTALIRCRHLLPEAIVKV